MADIQTLIQRHSRKLIGIGIMSISLMAAFALAGQADNSVSMWGAKFSLSPGSALKIGDLESVKVSLGNQAPKYFSSKASLVGSFLVKSISQGELIPVSAVTKSSSGNALKEIPVGISKSDLPVDLRAGDVVDLYSIPIKDPKAMTSLVASKVRVAQVDSAAQNMGGVVTVLFSVDQKVVLSITDAVQMGRIVVVRNAL
jgi:hypothetical protein